MNWQDLTSTGRLLRTRALGWTEGRAAARLLDLGDRHRGERALLAADLSVRQIQPVQAAAVCQGQRAAKSASRLLENAMLQRLSRRRIARLAADIDLLDERLLEIVAGDAALAHRYRLLTSMPGVGAVLACAAPLHKRCASLDVHKVEVVACCLISKRKVEREMRVQDLRSQLGQLRSIDDNNECSKGLRSNSFTGSRAYQPDFHLR